MFYTQSDYNWFELDSIFEVLEITLVVIWRYIDRIELN